MVWRVFNRNIIQSSSYNDGSVTATTGGAGNSHIGGIAGVNYGTITSSHNNGVIDGGSTHVYVGGIAGGSDFTFGTTLIDTVYNTGAVTGANHVGGIAGYLHPNGTISNSNNQGTVIEPITTT